MTADVVALWPERSAAVCQCADPFPGLYGAKGQCQRCRQRIPPAPPPDELFPEVEDWTCVECSGRRWVECTEGDACTLAHWPDEPDGLCVCRNCHGSGLAYRNETE
jgi:hypothetical protein